MTELAVLALQYLTCARAAAALDWIVCRVVARAIEGSFSPTCIV
jgi:hypothetical protein